MGLMTSMLIMAGVSTAISAYSQWKAGSAEKAVGEAQQRAANAQAQLADYNAAVAELQAKDALERGKIESDKFRSRVRVLVGEQRAGFAAGNIDVGYGSAVDVQADTTFQGELDALTIRNNAAREAWGYRVEQKDLELQAEVMRKEGVQLAEAGRQRQGAARLGAAGTVLTGASSMLQSYGFTRSSPRTTGPTSSPAVVYQGDALRSTPHA